MTFDEAFTLLIGNEGGFQKDRADAGNWTGGKVGVGILRGTKYGISAKSYPSEDIEALTLDRAKFIYRRDFWNPAHCDQVPEIVRFDLFDTAVHSGIVTGVKMLQRAAGVLDDGVFGPKTAAAVATYEPYRLLLHFNAERLDYLNDLSSWPSFGRGWTERIANNMRRV